MADKYHLLFLFQIRSEGLTYEEIEKLNETRPENEQWNAADAAVLATMVYPDDGSLETLLIPVDGRPEASPLQTLSDDEVFKVWSMLALRLARSQTLGPGRRNLCAQVHEAIAEALRSSRNKTPMADDKSDKN